jgi:hypothetical protein
VISHVLLILGFGLAAVTMIVMLGYCLVDGIRDAWKSRDWGALPVGIIMLGLIMVLISLAFSAGGI